MVSNRLSKNNFWGINRHSQPNVQNIETVILQNYRMDSSQILTDDKDLQVLLVGGPKMCSSDPRWWRPSCNIENRHISATV